VVLDEGAKYCEKLAVMQTLRKNLGQYFTVEAVAASLVKWTVRRRTDRLLDPSCGDGQFIIHHKRSVGVELDPEHARIARERMPAALIHGGDFFSWATETKERFEAVAGNPPFIRYQSFKGVTRAGALAAADFMGAQFNGLTSSWAPFVIVAASLLKQGGRMAFVVPAEIGHANYARQLLPSLCSHFSHVQVNAYREKFFPALSEDC
jgi:adenine-specific DNA-methyltransferase